MPCDGMMKTTTSKFNQFYYVEIKYTKKIVVIKLFFVEYESVKNNSPNYISILYSSEV